MTTGSDAWRPGRARATMRDVAALAGVGLTTVSRVVGGDDGVSEKKVAAVRSAIDELGYTPNDSARMLRSGATSSVGLLIENVADPFFSLLSQAVEEVVLANDSFLLSASSHRDAERAKKMILAFCSRRVNGLIIAPTEPEPDTSYLRREMDAGVAMVFVDRPPHGLSADYVVSANREGARAGVEHLLAHGHRRVACFTDRTSLYTARERIAGYEDALASAGIAVDPTIMHAMQSQGTFDFAAPLARMMRLPEPPTAVFTGNNRSTILILRELERYERRPALVGFDDFELADLVRPGVTVVRQFPGRMGTLAAELLFERLAGADGPAQSLVLPTELVLRGSGEIAR